ncbi:unnamed protein product [Darwinula stevensoni]|uniref:PHD-type domain-containing protein n=1 Tax=Darwinula stevensoni TaxID=69355 RepID=A0A7R8X6M1_9CRUS|nr:unnamed protein product [Darwinula stevensoni]CAG0885896.1 unnamed protein product [Darwinula stevensoni]
MLSKRFEFGRLCNGTLPMPGSPRQRHSKIAPLPVCGECLGTEARNPSGHPEELISCDECRSSAHPSCLKFSVELTQRVKSLKWQCMECKTCTSCGRRPEEGSFLICSTCDRGFHEECAQAKLERGSHSPWVCPLCVLSCGSKKGLSATPKAALVSSPKSSHRGKSSPRASKDETQNIVEVFTPKSSKSKKKPAAPEAEKVASAEPDGRQMRNHTSSDSESGGESLDKVSVEKMRFFCRRFKLEGSFDGQQSCSKLIRDNWSSLMGQKKLLEPQLPSKGSKKIKLSPNLGMSRVLLTAAPKRGGRGKSQSETNIEYGQENFVSAILWKGTEVLRGNKLMKWNSCMVKVARPSLPSGVTLRDYEMFKKAQEIAAEATPLINLNDPATVANGRCPASVEFGKYEIQTWYSSPYPQEYASLHVGILELDIEEILVHSSKDLLVVSEALGHVQDVVEASWVGRVVLELLQVMLAA